MTHLRWVAVVILINHVSSASADEPVFPGAAWRHKSPGEVGLDAAQLDRFAKAVGGDGVIVRDGVIVKQWGRPDRRADWASSAKPVISTLLLFAVEEGKLKSVDDPVRPWVRKHWPGKDLAEKDRTMTFRNLADMTSGYSRAEVPGTHWAYNDLAINLYRHLMTEVLGESLNAAALRRLAPLQFEDGDLFGSRDGAGVNTSPRDFARIGWFWLNRGNWNGKQLLPKKYFDDYMKPDVPRDLPRTRKNGEDNLAIGTYGGGNDQNFPGQGVYGFNWWFNAPMGTTGEMFLPGLPGDAFCTIGHRGKEVMLIVPSWKLVAAARGDWGDVRLTKTRLLAAAVQKPATLGDLGAFDKWQSVNVTLTGPSLQSRGKKNPFAITVDGVFTAPSGKIWTVPGYYDGDGKGGSDGNVWCIRFSADETGNWTFSSRSEEPSLAGQTARFTVKPASANAPGFYRWGRLEAVGTPENGIRYLKFRDGPYWLKAGCDDPENFLGNYKNYDTPKKRKAAVDYLAERGINSLYIMSHNIGGDDKDVWPWLGKTAKEAMAHGARDVRFDVTRLREWRDLFEHMQRRGVVVYLVLEDDSAWKGYDQPRYFREIVARFGDLPGLLFNLGEEHNENYSLSQGLAQAQQLAGLDPYDHPRGIHNVNDPVDAYVDAPQIDFTSIQTGSPGTRRGLKNALQHNQIAIDWLRRCKSRGRRELMVNFDEGRPELQRAAWWAAYLAGGVWEAHVLDPYDRPMSAWEKTWNELGGARAFMESLPFWEMNTHNELVKSGDALCLARPGAAYALYLPTGGTVTVELAAGANYTVEWWNPANNWHGQFHDRSSIGGGAQKLTAPAKGDWAVRIIAKTNRNSNTK